MTRLGTSWSAQPPNVPENVAEWRRCGEVEKSVKAMDGHELAGAGSCLTQRALAAPGEVLVSGTVKDLVAGSGITFEDRGVQVLKGASR
jgi:hypothetical protein